MVRKSKLTNKQLDILYECWKEGKDTKERLKLIEEKMPSNVSTLTALKVMRRMAKTNIKWLKWTTRQKNLKERSKLEKKYEIEKRKKEKEERKKERELKRKEKVSKQKQRSQKEYISKNINSLMSCDLEDQIPTEFFFCQNVQQFVTNITCVFRVFDDDFSFGSCCDKCNKMNKYVPIIKEIIDARPTKNIKRKTIKRHTTSSRRCETTIEKGDIKKAKATAKNNPKCTTRRSNRKS